MYTIHHGPNDWSIQDEQGNSPTLEQIVTALNAWQEIQQAYEIAQRSGDQIGKAGTVYLTVHALMPKNGVIPPNVRSAREETPSWTNGTCDCSACRDGRPLDECLHCPF